MSPAPKTELSGRAGCWDVAAGQRGRPTSREWLGRLALPRCRAVLRLGGGDALAADGAGDGDRAGPGQ